MKRSGIEMRSGEISSRFNSFFGLDLFHKVQRCFHFAVSIFAFFDGKDTPSYSWPSAGSGLHDGCVLAIKESWNEFVVLTFPLSHYYSYYFFANKKTIPLLRG
jgi:hypothetical protein